MLPVYIGCFLFGGILIGASAFMGHGHDADAGGGHDGDHGGGHHDADQAHGSGAHGAHPPASSWLPILSLRFWSFALAFFGLTGAALTLTAGASLVVPIVSAAAGLGAGAGASRLLRALAGRPVGLLAPGGSFVGREGKLLLPVDRAQRGKLRVSIGGASTDLVAETESEASLPAGSTVLIVGMRGNVALVERNPAALPAPVEAVSRKETS